jgi:outer membrane immunogenic protein
MDSFLLGVEADASWSGMEGSYRRIEIGGGYYFNADTDVEWLASLRTRAGFVWEKALIYGTGGIAFAGSDTGITSDYSGADVSTSDSITHTGWVLGAGIETKIASNMTARLEYLHYDFGGADIFYRLDPLSDAYDAFGDAELDVDIIRLGVNILF